MQLEPEQLVLVGIVASVITAALRFVAAKLGWTVPASYAKILVFVVAVVLAAVWMKPEVGFSEDPLQFAGNLLAAAIAVMGAARAIYELLLGRLGLSKLASA